MGIFGDFQNPAWDDRTTEVIEKAETVIPQAFRETVAALGARYGDKISKWNWNSVAPFYATHPFGSQKQLAKLLNRGPLPSMGGVDTVYKHQFMRKEMVHFPIKYGPVLRVMIDFSDLPGSRMSLPGGQSGRPVSRHYDDQLPLFLTGQGVSMEMDLDKIRKDATGMILLTPAD
jgi:penicillin amidase